jgi:hypothetical protein
MCRRYGEMLFEDAEVSILRGSWQRARVVMKSKPYVPGPLDDIDEGTATPGTGRNITWTPSTSSSATRHWSHAILDLKLVTEIRHSALLRTMKVEIIGAIVAIAVLAAFLLAVVFFGLNLGK